jgi:hypothetical protein
VNSVAAATGRRAQAQRRAETERRILEATMAIIAEHGVNASRRRLSARRRDTPAESSTISSEHAKGSWRSSPRPSSRGLIPIPTVGTGASTCCHCAGISGDDVPVAKIDDATLNGQGTTACVPAAVEAVVSAHTIGKAVQ